MPTLVFLAAMASVPATDPATADIARLEQQWGDAFLRRDYDFMERIVAPGYRLVIARSNGDQSITRRAEWMSNARIFRYSKFDVETVDVNRDGDTAIATVKVFNLVAMKPGESPRAHRSFVTDTWVRRHGKWQVIHRYSHRLPDPISPASITAAPN